jgi:hypothetical protein
VEKPVEKPAAARYTSCCEEMKNRVRQLAVKNRGMLPDDIWHQVKHECVDLFGTWNEWEPFCPKPTLFAPLLKLFPSPPGSSPTGSYWYSSYSPSVEIIHFIYLLRDQISHALSPTFCGLLYSLLGQPTIH